MPEFRDTNVYVIALSVIERAEVFLEWLLYTCCIIAPLSDLGIYYMADMILLICIALSQGILFLL